MKIEVVGGSSGGLRTSHLLAERGHEVTLREAGEIGDGISCGEAYLDIYPEVERPKDGLIREYARVFHKEDGRQFSMDGCHTYQYDKSAMLRGMKEKAESAGVHIREDCKKTNPSQDHLTVDASGFPSILYSPEDYDKAFAVSCAVDGKTDEMVFDWREDGYFWAFPKRATTNAGFVTFLPPFDGVRERAVGYSRKIGGVQKVSGGFIPFSLDKPLWNRDTQTVLIGDAAALASSFHGGGIHAALLSARILADNVDNLNRYESILSHRMQDECRMAEVAAEFRGEGRLDELLQLLQPSDDIREITKPSLLRKMRVLVKWKIPIIQKVW